VIAAARRSPVPASPAAAGGKVNIVQGEQFVSADAELMISTLLGSCVAACLRDPVAKVGGMNHFLLPGKRAANDAEGLRFGVHAMELLVNALLSAGARRERLECKLFGGAHMMDGLADVGRQNGDFAIHFLQAEGIRYLGGSLGGTAARRVQFWPASGRARQLLAGQGEDAVFAQEIRRAAPTVQDARDCGAVELF
jgi:chemotaxis protein CheD